MPNPWMDNDDWRWDINAEAGPSYPGVKKGAGYQAYGKILQGQLRERPAARAYRQVAFDSIGRNVRGAEEAARGSSAAALGIQNASAMPAQVSAIARAQAPYAEARMKANQIGRAESRQAGQDLFARRQANANYWATVMGPWLQNKNIEAGLGLGMASLAPPEEQSLAGPIISSIGSIGVAAILAGA